MKTNRCFLNLCALSVFLLIQPLSAQVKDHFSYLKWIEVSREYQGIHFGYPPEQFKLINQAIDQLSPDHPNYKQDDDSYNDILIGSYQNDSMNAPVHILFSHGPSADPFFYITDNQGELLWEYLGDEMGINANGIIYLAGHSDKMFNERSKWQLKNNKVKEIKQPYYYVGIKDKTLKPIKLYAEKSGKNIVASIPKGYEIEVLLADTQSEKESGMLKHYLVRTKFGLVGWLILSDEETFSAPVVKELRYWGD